MATFEIFRSARGEYGWRMKAANGEVLAVSAGTYVTKDAARKAVESLRREVGSAQVKALT